MLNIPEEIGNRLKYLRIDMANATQAELAEEADVGLSSIKAWEAIRHEKVLSRRSLGKILKALKRRWGIVCAEEWVLTGKGKLPNYENSAIQSGNIDLINTVNKDSSLYINNSYFNSNEEISLFQSLHKDAVVITINHNSLLPILEKEDTVGGIWRSSSSLTKEKICIVEVKGKLDVRKVKPHNENSLFNLCYVSYESLSTEPFEIQNIKIERVAPIVRVWKPILL